MITLNRAWYIYYGSLFGMSRKESLLTLYGEMRDLIDCKTIAEGKAKPKAREMTFEEIIRLE